MSTSGLNRSSPYTKLFVNFSVIYRIYVNLRKWIRGRNYTEYDEEGILFLERKGGGTLITSTHSKFLIGYYLDEEIIPNSQNFQNYYDTKNKLIQLREILKKKNLWLRKKLSKKRKYFYVCVFYLNKMKFLISIKISYFSNYITIQY